MTRRLSILSASFWRSARLAWSSAPLLAACHAGSTLLQALLPFGAMISLRHAIDAATRFLTSPAIQNNDVIWSPATLLQTSRQNADFRSLILWMAFGAACLFLAAAVRMLTAWIGEFHALAVTDRVYDMLHTTLMRADLAFFENPDDQNRLYLAREQALTRPPRILASLNQILHSLTGLLGVLVILARFSLLLPLVLVIGALPVLSFKLTRARRFYDWRKNLTPLEREAAYFHAIMTENAGAKEIRLYGHGDYCRGRFEIARARLREERLAWRRYVVSQEAAGLFAGLLATGLILFWMTGRLLAGALTVGALVLCAQTVQRGQGAISNLLNAVAALFEDALFLQSFEELLSLAPAIGAPATARPVPEPIRHGISIEQVTFTYPGASQPAIRNLSLTLRPGERVALTGGNGAGKSTLIKLLCRLYDPDSGRILVDGMDLRDMDPALWRSRIGAFFQDFNHYQLTAEDNIRMGHPPTQAGDPAIERAARDAGLASLLALWPQGLKTRLGRWLHDGVEPSVGQWQKIALARAFLRPAALYILDEPTSAMDPASQQDALDALARLSCGRIVIISSHRRLSSTAVDRVLTLDQGELTADAPPSDSCR